MILHPSYGHVTIASTKEHFLFHSCDISPVLVIHKLHAAQITWCDETGLEPRNAGPGPEPRIPPSSCNFRLFESKTIQADLEIYGLPDLKLTLP